jgi:fructose/tagatose bisphosphate aldolase
VLGAAIAEGYQGPVFLQGDHFQISPARYATDPQSEIAAVRDLIATAIKVGFYNIDIDASTLVNLDAPSPAAQQAENGRVTAILSATIRDLEPAGITVAIGGEIGEVGSHLSTPVELEAFMTCFHKEMAQLAPEKPSLCKISVHTGTKHGGEMRPDGSFAPIELDFAALQTMSALARTKYGMGGCVQHGASTLSMAYFPKLAAHGAVEVHLATGLMRTFYTHIPESLRREMRDWMEMEYAAKREPEMSDVQFYHSVEMLALRPFKSKILALSSDELFPLMAAWETQFEEFINHLGVADSASWISPYAGAVSATFSMTDYQNIIPSEILLNDLAG